MDTALEIHAHYTKLFEAFAVLPAYDIKRELAFGSIEKYLKHAKYREYGEYLERLRNYLKTSWLEPEKQQIITGYIDEWEPLNRLDILYPECRVFLHERDRFDLKVRFYILLNGPDADRAAQFWAMGSPNSSLFDKRSAEEIEQSALLMPDTDTRARLDVIKKCLDILNERANPSPKKALDLTKKYVPGPGKPTCAWPDPLPLDKILPPPQPDSAALNISPPAAPAPNLAAAITYPWAEIEALAVRIELRKDGGFTPAGNRIAAAVAGLIDALLDNNIISDTVTRPIHYANFSEHYDQPIGVDRVRITRTHWHQKARKELGLPDLKPPKLRA